MRLARHFSGARRGSASRMLLGMRDLRALSGSALVLVIGIAAAPTLPRAQAGSAQLLVLNKNDATLAFVDPTSGQVTARVPTGDGPHEVVVSTDGTLAFAANYGATSPGSTISVVDIRTRKELRRVGPIAGAIRGRRGR